MNIIIKWGHTKMSYSDNTMHIINSFLQYLKNVIATYLK